MEKRLCMLDWTKVPHNIQFWLDEKLKAHPDEADVYASVSEDTRYILSLLLLNAIDDLAQEQIYRDAIREDCISDDTYAKANEYNISAETTLRLIDSIRYPLQPVLAWCILEDIIADIKKMTLDELLQVSDGKYKEAYNHLTEIATVMVAVFVSRYIFE